MYLVQQGAIPPLCGLLSLHDAKVSSTVSPWQNETEALAMMVSGHHGIFRGFGKHFARRSNCECIGPSRTSRHRLRRNLLHRRFFITLMKAPILTRDCNNDYLCSDLQHHDNTQIYTRAVKILETYFGGEEETDSEVNPNYVVGAGGVQQVR